MRAGGMKVLPQTTEWKICLFWTQIFTKQCRWPRFSICRNRRFVKYVCRRSQINFNMPQTLRPSKHKLTLIKVTRISVCKCSFSIHFLLFLSHCVILCHSVAFVWCVFCPMQFFRSWNKKLLCLCKLAFKTKRKKRN